MLKGLLQKRRIVLALLVIELIAVAGASIYVFIHPQGRTSNPEKFSAPPAKTLTAEECAYNLPLKFLAGQVLMVGLPANELSDQALIFKSYSVGGAVLMTSPTDPYDGSIKKFKIDALTYGIQPLISTDEEGGSIQRFSSLGLLPAPTKVAETMTTLQAQSLIAEHGQKLKAIGIDMILGPLADVGPTEGIGILEDRVFSNNPGVVANYDVAYVKGWQSAGLIPTLKHFPGLGSVTANTDYMIGTTPSLSQLEDRDLIPYQRLVNDNPAVMVGNQNVPGWFSGPASLSPVADTYLRNNLGYKNHLVITDSLSAAAVTSQIQEYQAIGDAIKAGNDIALFVEIPGSSLASNEKIISQAVNRIEGMVLSGALPRRQLASSVVRKLDAQHIQACSIKKSQP